MTGADVGEAEQLGCGQVLREGISPAQQLRQKCLLWGSRGERRENERAGEGGWGAGLRTGVLGLLAPATNNSPWGQIHIKSISQMTPEGEETSFIKPFIYLRHFLPLGCTG